MQCWRAGSAVESEHRALTEDECLLPSTYVAPHNHLQSQLQMLQHSLLASEGARHAPDTHIYLQTCIHIKYSVCEPQSSLKTHLKFKIL